MTEYAGSHAHNLGTDITVFMDALADRGAEVARIRERLVVRERRNFRPTRVSRWWKWRWPVCPCVQNFVQIDQTHAERASGRLRR